MTDSELKPHPMNRNSESQYRRDKYDCVCIPSDSVSDENKYEKNPERYHEMSHVKKLAKPFAQGVSSQCGPGNITMQPNSRHHRSVGKRGGFGSDLCAWFVQNL